MVQSSAAPNENRSDKSIEEGPLTPHSHVQASSLTGNLCGSSGLELINDDDGPTLPMELMGEITSDLPPFVDNFHIEVCNEDDGPELSHSMMPAAVLEAIETGSISTKGGCPAASKFKVDTIDEKVHAARDNVRCVDRNDDDDYKLPSKHDGKYSWEGNVDKELASKHVCEYSGEGNFEETNTGSTTNETASHGEDFVGSNVDDVVGYVHHHQAGRVSSLEHPENPTRPSSARRTTIPGVFSVRGIYSDAEEGRDVESLDAVSRASVPEAFPVNVGMREEYDGENLIMASRLDPWLRRRSMRRIIVTAFIVLVGSAIAYGVSQGRSEVDTPPTPGIVTQYSCVANPDCDDGIWCNGMCSISGNLSLFMCANNHCTCTHTFHIDKPTL